MDPTISNLGRSGLFTKRLNQRNWIAQQSAPHTVAMPVQQRAQLQAYQRFAELHPVWAESLFDLHFLSHVAAPLIARYLNTYAQPIAEEFVLAWWSQFSRRTIEPHEMAMAVPVAADFMRILDAELRLLSPLERTPNTSVYGGRQHQ